MIDLLSGKLQERERFWNENIITLFNFRWKYIYIFKSLFDSKKEIYNFKTFIVMVVVIVVVVDDYDDDYDDDVAAESPFQIRNKAKKKQKNFIFFFKYFVCKKCRLKSYYRLKGS